MPRSISFWAALFVAIPVGAYAQNGSTPGALELYPNFNAVGVRLPFTGDANGNATAQVQWRLQGSGTWIPGVAMTRITNSRWAASVLWLTPDTPYEVRAVIADPDGGGSATGSVRTRKDPPATPTGRTWWVATNGSDANDGSSGAPLASLQAAADRGQPGDEVRLRPGIYYQTVQPNRAGTATALLHMVADGPGVILDGADPALMHTTWQNDGGGVYSIAYTASTRLVCADSLQRLYHHASLAELQADGGVAQGWVIENGRMYVKLEDRSSPAGHTMYIARYNYGIYLDQPYWRINGLELRHYGTALGGSPLRVSTNGCVVSNNYIHSNGGRGVFIKGPTAGDNLVEHNTVYDHRISTWPWSATKGHWEEIQGISNRGGRGNVIRYNTIKGIFDGVDAGDGDTDETVAADCDIHDNLVIGVRDDGFETENISAINMRVWHNRCIGCFSGMSIAPNYQGPEYVLYNALIDYQRGGFKFSISSTGQNWICHNTLTSSNSGTPAVYPSGPYSNMHFRNNILIGNGASSVSDDAGESQTGNDFDGDLINSIGAALFRWKNTNYTTIAALRSGTGFETGGQAGDPLFSAPSSGDYTLRSGSPAIDGALRLTGINDAFSGAAPDMGAFEFGGPDVTPPAAVQDLRTAP